MCITSWHTSYGLLCVLTMYLLLCIASTTSQDLTNGGLVLNNATVAVLPTKKHNIVKKGEAELLKETLNDRKQQQSAKQEKVESIAEKAPQMQSEQQQQHGASIPDKEAATQTEKIIVISEKPSPPERHSSNDEVLKKSSIRNSDFDIPDAYKSGFYFFFGISSAALLFIVVRIYRLRLSRAERKYGVQGDRANQELTPLPMAIEDINSDEDDHTLFDINNQNIRIL